jgi:glutathione S-transferase
VLLGTQSPEVMKAFGADRAAFTAGMRRVSTRDAAAQLPVHLKAFDAQLADGRRWLLGDVASIADFSVAHCLWFIRRTPLMSVFDPHPHLKALARTGAGHRPRRARAHGRGPRPLPSPPRPRARPPPWCTPNPGCEAGQAVTVSALDYGSDPWPARWWG